MMNKLESFTSNAKRAYILVGSTLGLFVAGLAPAILFGYSLYSALLTLEWGVSAAIAAGISLSITMEVVGSLSAYVAQNSRNPNTRYFGYGVLGIYTIIGLAYMIVIENNPVIQRTGVMSYLVAPMLYFAVALLNSTLQQEDEKRQAIDIRLQERQEDRTWQRQQQAIQEQHAHEQKLKSMELDADVKKAKVQPVNRLQVDTVARQPHTVDDLTPAQRRIYEAIQQNPGSNHADIGRQLGISRQAVGKHIKAMNGVSKQVFTQGA